MVKENKESEKDKSTATNTVSDPVSAGASALAANDASEVTIVVNGGSTLGETNESEGASNRNPGDNGFRYPGRGR